MNDAPVASPLDRLEAKGRRYARGAARHRAVAAGVRWGSGAALAGAALLFVSALSGGVPAWWAAAVVPVAGIVVAVVAALVVQGRVRVARATALGLLDQRLDTRDRIGTVDEFAAMPARDGFRQAAIEEAAPWLRQALEARIDSPAPPRVVPGRVETAMLVVAAALLLLAFLVGGGLDGRHRGGGQRAAGVAATAGGSPSRAATAMERMRAVAARVAASLSAGTAGAAGAPSSSAASQAAPAGRAGAGAGAPGKGGATEARQPSAGAATTVRPNAGAGSPGSRSGAPGSAGSPQDSMPASTVDKVQAAGSPAERNDAPAPPPATATPPAPARPPASPGSQAAAAAAAQRASAAAAQQASKNGQQSGDGPKASRGQGGQMNGSRNNARGRPSPFGGTTGSDALKRARGAAALMLAVPMDDRVTGTANAGRSTSVLRPSRPRGSPAPVVAAGDRGSQNGTAGDVVHRATSAHDDEVVRDYFLRRNGQAR